MATTDILVLPSSPLKQFSTYNIPSSPTLLSPNEVFKHRTPLSRTGDRAPLIAQTAVVPFTTKAALAKKPSPDNPMIAGTLSFVEPLNRDDQTSIYFNAQKPIKSKRKGLGANDEPTAGNNVKGQRKAASLLQEGDNNDRTVKKARKPRAKKTEESGGAVESVKKATTRKPRSKNIEKEKVENGPVKEKSVRKPRKKKAEGDTQPKLPKGRVTKSSSGLKPGDTCGAPEAKKLELMSRGWADPFSDPPDYGLAKAVSRRTDWTPPSSSVMSVPIDQAIVGGELGNVVSADPDEGIEGFHNLARNFGFVPNETKCAESNFLYGAGTRKRKLIELVQTNVQTAAAASNTKSKAPKKKPRTITDLATSVYAEEQEEDLPGHPAPLLQYFTYQTSDNDANGGFKVPRKPRSQLPSKGTSRFQKGNVQAPILLSPESALKQVGHQDFVFGTSSQLAREDSPTLLRDLHDAMQASNQIDSNDPFAELINEPSTPTDFPQAESTATTNRTLWSAGARDASGNLLDMEVIDMVNQPVVVKLPGGAATKSATPALSDADEAWHNVEGIIESVPTVSKPREPAPGDTQTTGASTVRAGASTIPVVCTEFSKDEALNHQPLKSTETSKGANMPFNPTQLSTTSTVSNDFQMPKFDSYTTAQLTKEVASYHFKPIKNREQMIKLLEKCWESKVRIVLGTLGPNVRPVSPAETLKAGLLSSKLANPESPKRPRGRPRKNSAVNSAASSSQSKTKAKGDRPKATDKAKAFDSDGDTPRPKIRTPEKPKSTVSRPVDEIYDSDPPTPSPPRRRHSQIGKTLSLKLSSTVDDDVTTLTAADSSHESLFIHITRAIKNAPRSKTPLEPNWHEKMLLYDPIIIEDLTLWLNTGALEKEGWDGEVTPKEIKKWCASKSICCLWKENLRGAARNGY